MADVTLTYKGATIAELDDSGSKTIRTAGKFCEADIGVEYVKPSGGGSQTENMETGSFVAVAPLDAVTIPVTSRRSHVVIWLDGLTSQTDLTDAPYGKNVLTFWYGDGNTGFTAQGQINYAGTSFSGAFQIIGAGGTQNLCSFTDTNIVISKMRVNGSNRPMVSGATYNWEAW